MFFLFFFIVMCFVVLCLLLSAGRDCPTVLVMVPEFEGKLCRRQLGVVHKTIQSQIVCVQWWRSFSLSLSFSLHLSPPPLPTSLHLLVMFLTGRVAQVVDVVSHSIVQTRALFSVVKTFREKNSQNIEMKGVRQKMGRERLQTLCQVT